MRFLNHSCCRFFSLTLLLLFCCSSIVFSQTERYSRTQFTKGNDTLKYRIVYPDAYDHAKYPLVVFLHGSGERGTDNEAQLKWGVQNFTSDEMMVKYPAIVVAPQCAEGETWSNFEGFGGDGDLKLKNMPSKPMELVIDLIHQLIEGGSVDPSRVYITGLSMGGLGTFDAIERYPDLFAAAIPVAGGGDPTLAHRIKDIPIWNFHGALDKIVPPKYSRSVILAIHQLGGHPGNTEIPDVGHFSWLAAYSNPQVLAWLFRQHK